MPVVTSSASIGCLVEIRAAGHRSIIDAEVGSATANSYVSLDDADAYFFNRPFSSDWFALESIDKERALMTATSELDLFDYIGEVVDDDQALKWPRQIDDSTLVRTYARTIIPPPIGAATCELALSRQSSGGVAVAGAVSSMQIGSSVKINYASGADAVETIDFSGLPIKVARLLAGLRLYALFG